MSSEAQTKTVDPASFRVADVLFLSPLERHGPALTALRDALGGGDVLAGAGFSDALRTAFAAGRPTVGLCAAGILIRLLADQLHDKHSEPPVVMATEAGDFVPLLGGHHGANRLAQDLGEAGTGFALISTASDAALGAAVEDPAPGYALVNPEHATAFLRRLAAGEADDGIRVVGDWPLRSDGPTRQSPDATLSIGTEGECSERHLRYCRRDLVIGLGCERGAEPHALAAAVTVALDQAGVDHLALAGIASVDLKQDEPAFTQLAERLGLPLRFFSAEALAGVSVPNPSAVVAAEIGTPSVAEAAALLGACNGQSGVTEQPTHAGSEGGEEAVEVLKGAGQASAELVLEKQKFGIGTVALARALTPITDFDAVGQPRGRLQLIGLGPGRADWRLGGAAAALRSAEHLVGYRYYIDQVSPLPHQQVHTFDLGEEERRCQFALDLAATGKSVALICSGDAGVYAMGALTFELAAQSDERRVQAVEIIAHPGISAMFGAAARLGAPLGHDFCAVSLSDLMTPWSVIERRLKGAASADFVVCFYNPVSRKRDWQLGAARDILLDHRPPETPVVICRQIGRAEESYTHRTLGTLDPAEIDMFCMVLVGSSQTRRFQPVKNGPTHLYTPRGYLNRGEDPTE